jgi:predicted SPOUT superfamily RNA methylase MTH1
MLKTEQFNLVISTARMANNFVDIVDKIIKRWNNAERVLIAFGAPSRGLHEIVKEEGMRLETISDFIVNTVPKQGTTTVRTEEALLISLSLLNTYLNL